MQVHQLIQMNLGPLFLFQCLRSNPGMFTWQQSTLSLIYIPKPQLLAFRSCLLLELREYFCESLIDGYFKNRFNCLNFYLLS